VARPARPAKTASQGWSAKLARPIVLRDNMTLETLADARAFVVAISDSKGRDAWQSVAAALLRAAKDSHLIEAATSDLELTLLVQGLLKLTASESISPESEKFEPALHEHWR
jgi:hypothetical protein